MRESYLIEHRGSVLSKDDLMSAVWPDTVVEENNLGQNISKLRSVLGESPGDHRWIVTLPGRAAGDACRGGSVVQA